MKKITIKKKEEADFKGIYTITKAKLETPKQWKLHNKIVKARKEGKEFMTMVRQLNKICKVKIYKFDNIIPTVARTMIINNLMDTSPDNAMVINFGAVGTDDTAVANGDTTLNTETFRKAIASITNSTNTGYASIFYDATEVTGTFKEAGIFSDGTGSADSGILVSRVLLNPTSGIVKSNVETMTVDWIIQLN